MMRSFALLFLSFAASLSAQPSGKTYVIRKATVHTLAGEPIEKGTVIVRDGRIAGVGRNLGVPRGAEVIDAAGLHVYPGMIDAFSFLGLTEVGRLRATVDLNEKGDFNPQLEAVTAVHPASDHIPVTRANGITHALIAPGSRGLMPGQASLIHLDGWTWEEMRIESSTAVVLIWPTIRFFPGPARSTPSSVPRTYKDAKKKYDERVAELDRWMESARHYSRAKASATSLPETDTKMESLRSVIEQERPLLVVANQVRDIRNAIAFADKHKVKMILAGGFESWKVVDLLKEKQIPVILRPTQVLPGHEDDPYDRPFTIASDLHEAGVRFAFGTFNSANSRVLPYEAAGAVAFGLPRDEALRAVTIYPAQILGIDDRFGTIEEGKVANLIVTDGDPLEIRTHTKHLFINGRPTSTDNKHRQLYEKHRQRPRQTGR